MHRLRAIVVKAKCPCLQPLRRFTNFSPSTYGYDEDVNPTPRGAPWLNQTSVSWSPFAAPEDWLQSTNQSLSSIKENLDMHGFAIVHNIVPETLLDTYRGMHELLVSGQVKTPGRHDLGSHKAQANKGSENIGQIMWPSDIVQGCTAGPFHARAFKVAHAMLGEDTAFDFDMLIYKDAETKTETPWHQDEAYWPPGMADKRALTVWCALDAATIENGAMWFVRGSHKLPLLHHDSAAEGSHVLMTREVNEETEGAMCVPLTAGSAVLWHGRTAHFSRGNGTRLPRRTFIANFRPESMVAFERENGFDHLRKGFKDYESQMDAVKHV